MAEQKKKETRPTKPKAGDDAAGKPEFAKKGKKIKEDLDNLLDEIDDILDENAGVREELRSAGRPVSADRRRAAQGSSCRSTSTAASMRREFEKYRAEATEGSSRPPSRLPERAHHRRCPARPAERRGIVRRRGWPGAVAAAGRLRLSLDPARQP